MPVLLLIAFTVLLVFLGLFIRRRNGAISDEGSLLRFLAAAVALALATSYILVPAFWLGVVFSLNERSTIEQSLMPGSDVKEILGAMVLGALAFEAAALYAFIKTCNRGDP